MNLYKLLATTLGLMLLAGCGDSGPQIPAGEESKYLLSLKTSESLGDRVGAVSLSESGILIHPGETTPTTVNFALDGKIHSVVLKPFIAKLDEEGQKHADAGVVGVEFFVDGKSVDKFQVDRSTNLDKTVDVKGAKALEIRVDNGNGTPIWDWFTVKVVSIK